MARCRLSWAVPCFGAAVIQHVYVAGPFSAPDRAGVERNIARAVDMGVEVARLGAYPVVPHANTADPRYEHAQPYEFWIDGTARQLSTCDAMILCEGWENSSGSRGEITISGRLGLPIFPSDLGAPYSRERALAELDAWLREQAADTDPAPPSRASIVPLHETLARVLEGQDDGLPGRPAVVLGPGPHSPLCRCDRCLNGSE